MVVKVVMRMAVRIVVSMVVSKDENTVRRNMFVESYSTVGIELGNT